MNPLKGLSKQESRYQVHGLILDALQLFERRQVLLNTYLESFTLIFFLVCFLFRAVYENLVLKHGAVSRSLCQQAGNQNS